MRTKLLRFNKQLPRIDTLHPNQSPSPGNTASPFNPSPNRRTEGPDVNDMVQAVMKQTQNAQPYELQPRDRNVLVQLPQIDDSDDIPMDILKTWISEVCTKVVSGAFNLLIGDKLSYEQAKVFCSQGILRNMVLLVQRYQLNKDHIKELNSHIEINVVPYLKRKYPMTESSDVNKSLDDSVRPVDKTDALENDLLFKSEVIFTYEEHGNYNKKIMEFLNWLMLEIDTPQEESSTGKTVFQEFFDYMSKTFEKVYSENWMNKSRESIIKNISVSKAEQSKIDASAPDISHLIAGSEQINEKYAEQVKDYTHYVIGRKISKNVPVYSDSEIEEGHLTIKSPAVLRILTKWCEELQSKFKKKNFFLDREQNLKVQQKNGNVNTMFMWMKQPLNDMIQTEKQKIYQFMNDLLMNNFDQQTELLKQELFQDDGFYHIDKIEKVCGKFATKTINNLHSYIVLYLNRLIHGLVSVSKQLYEEKLSTKARWNAPPDLLTFKVGDLMRCKCSSKEREILHIYKELERISKVNPETLKIIRVKNRLKLGTNDILINILYKDKFLCQIQLAVKSAQSKFISCSNSWNHYIYELGRTIFGPITELSSVWMSLDPRSAEYAHIISNQKPRKIADDEVCVNMTKKHSMKYHNRPFICSKCKLAYSHSNYFWHHMKCDVLGCSYVICATCRIDDQKEEILKQKLLKQEPVLLKASKGIINRKKQSEQNLPQYGVCIPINSKHIKVQKFKRIIYKNIWTIFGLVKDKRGKERVIKIDEHIKKSAERKFLKKYLVIEINGTRGEDLIDITLDRAKKQCLIPAKVKEIYKKQKQIMSLIEQNIDDESIQIIQGKKQAMKHIKNLQLADNKLTNINFISHNFKKLDRLQLSRNLINNIDGISILQGLVKLNLRNNKLAALPDEICRLSNLKGLNIRFNQITALPKDFGELTLIDKLESDNNLIAELPDSFQKLKRLKFIDLSSNKLTKFPEHIKQFRSLKELNLSKNQLGHLPDWISELQNCLSTLDLYKTGLQNIPSSLFLMQKLQILKIESSVETLSSDISKMSSLKELCIQMKNLKRIPQDIFKLKQLEILLIEDCQMKDLPDCLSEMEKLQSFGLINNKLETLSKELFEMVGIKNLRLQGQNLPKIPDELIKLVNLRTLSLSNNKLVDFPEIILKFTKIYSLKLKNTQLRNIPNNLIKHLPDLEELDISKNDLTTLPISLSDSKKLTERKFKYDKDKVKVPQSLEFVVKAFNQTVSDHTFFARTLTLSHLMSHRMQSQNSQG